MIKRAVDYRAQFGSVPLFATLCQATTCIISAEPGGVAFCFLRTLGVIDFQQKSLYDEFLGAIAQPGVALGLQVEMEMLGLNRANRTGLLQRLALRGLAVR
jgi:hypothetical protein